MKKALPLTVAAVKGIRSPILPGRTVRPKKGRGSYSRQKWKGDA
jgi:stalled ribosome alternative rescue factor ArfA